MLLVVGRVVTTAHLVTHTPMLWPGLVTYTKINSASQLTPVSLFFFSVIRTYQMRLTAHTELKQNYNCQMIFCKKSNNNSIALGSRPVVGVPANGVPDLPTQIPSNPP